MGTVGDPKLDLGWVIQGWPEDTSGGDGSVGGYVDLTGHARRAPSCSPTTPRCRAGRSTTSTTTCILARWKLAIVLEQGYQRAGDTEKGAAFGPIVVELIKSAAELAATTDYNHKG